MTSRIIELEEYSTKELSHEQFDHELAHVLYARYSSQVTIELPSFLTKDRWRLTSQGYVGYLPLSNDVALYLKPKVGLSNLFRMLELAYKIPINLPGGSFQADSLEELYARLAHILARRVLDRSRKGFYRTYLPQEDILPFLREKINITSMIRFPWKVDLDCMYNEFTADIPENQLLAWTLEVILKSGICGRSDWSRREILPYIRQAYREISNVATSFPFSAKDCIGRTYNRLNEDYRLLHGLCRFFLEHTGPGYQLGDHLMAPFLIDMNRLFEAYVAAWLNSNLPSGFVLREQENVSISSEFGIRYKIDLVLVDSNSGKILCVLDTKYKKPEFPSTVDISEVVAYAESTGCSQSFLIYPSPLTHPINFPVGSKQVHCLVFNLGDDLLISGNDLRDTLLSILFH